MLSQSLTAYAAHFEQWSRQPGGVTIDPRICAIIAGTFTSYAEQAECLEAGRPAPPLGGLLPANLASLADAREARAAARGAA
jgi:hypothetical protein